MESDKYSTIKSVSQGVYKDKGSKFLSFAYPVKNEEGVKHILTALKKQYHDARHCCFAYRLGIDVLSCRVNDDGEPSGTAGKPILGQIISNNLTDILIVVVRYFGGKLLGTSGLIKAYRMAAKDCLTNASFTECKAVTMFEIIFPYEHMNSIMQVVKKETVIIVEQNINVDCKIILKTEKKLSGRIMQLLSKLKDVKTRTIP